MPPTATLPAIRPVPRRRATQRVEDALQTTVVTFLRHVLPSSYLVFSIPNEAKRGPALAARMKRMGLMAGVGDLVILGPQGRCWLIEIKTDDGRLSDAQKTFHSHCIVNCIPYVVARSISDVREALSLWRIPTREAA